MNFVVIISDTLRWDHLGASGNKWIHTPNLDKLAAQSLVFDRAYTGSFPTIPHRTDVMTGRWVYPYRGWTTLPKDEIILSQTLSDAGYTTMLIADTPHLMRDGHCFDRGFTAWKWNRGQESDRSITDLVPFEPPCDDAKTRNPRLMKQYHWRWRARHWRTERDTHTARTFQDAADWIELNHKHERFFLYVDTFDPHEPWDPPQHYVDLYDPGYAGQRLDHPPFDFIDRIGATPNEVKHARALYAGEVTLLDTWLGRLMEKLEYCGKLDDTVVIFHSDHGFNIGDHGRFGKTQYRKEQLDWPFFEEVSHVPLMIRAPLGPRGRRSHFLAQGVDLMPTILDLAGVATPPTVRGVSLAPVLVGDGAPKRSVAITTHELNATSDYCATLCSSITNGVWTLHYRGNETAWELFNVAEDPGQKRNLARSRRDVAQRLHRQHLAQLRHAGVREEVVALRSRLP